jgi:hypothetical protein
VVVWPNKGLSTDHAPGTHVWDKCLASLNEALGNSLIRSMHNPQQDNGVMRTHRFKATNPKSPETIRFRILWRLITVEPTEAAEQIGIQRTQNVNQWSVRGTAAGVRPTIPTVILTKMKQKCIPVGAMSTLRQAESLSDWRQMAWTILFFNLLSRYTILFYVEFNVIKMLIFSRTGHQYRAHAPWPSTTHDAHP